MRSRVALKVPMAVVLGLAVCFQYVVAAPVRVRLTVTSKLPPCNVPMDPAIDFGELIKQAGLPGVLDPNSIEVIDLKTGKPVPHAVTEDFAYGDKGRIEWVIKDPTHTEYEIRFRTVEKRPPLRPANYTPLIGTGDLLRYNAGVPRPFALPSAARLIDLTGDGKRDLVGCWSYAYRPGDPWDGIICYPRVGGADRFEFGDLVRVRYLDDRDSTAFHHFTSSSHAMSADFADLNGDGLIDVAFRPQFQDQYYFYLNSGERDDGGMPKFVAAGSVPVPKNVSKYYGSFRVVDVDGDGALDIVARSRFCRNTNPNGWPIRLADGVSVGVGQHVCFYDVDRDGKLDAVDCIGGNLRYGRPNRVAWRRNLGTTPPSFGPAQVIEEIPMTWVTNIAAVNDGPRRGLLVAHGPDGSVAFYEQLPDANGKPKFKLFGRAMSGSAVICIGDQNAPYVCDWDADGDWDLLAGGGRGWPRILINEGTNERPRFAEAQRILADGKPIRILRNEILGAPFHGHNMGYLFPAYVDWDDDDLPDLMLPNETNRIFWYKNIGTRRTPKFGERRQVICDGYPDSPKLRAQSATRAKDPKSNNGCYPYEKEQPFMWRTGAAFADFNGDGLTDMVTLGGTAREARKAVLFTQYRDEGGTLRLKRDGFLKFADGKEIDDSFTGRRRTWTESFKSVDWDGDGLTDLLYSLAGSHHMPKTSSSIYVLRNCGTKTAPKFEKPTALNCFGKPIRITNHGPHAAVADMDGDGKLDILCHLEWAVYPFYSHAALTMKTRPTYSLSRAAVSGD